VEPLYTAEDVCYLVPATKQAMISWANRHKAELAPPAYRWWRGQRRRLFYASDIRVMRAGLASSTRYPTKSMVKGLIRVLNTPAVGEPTEADISVTGRTHARLPTLRSSVPQDSTRPMAGQGSSEPCPASAARPSACSWQDALAEPPGEAVRQLQAPAGAKPYLRRLLGNNPVVVTKTATGWSYEFRGILNPVLKGLIDYVEVLGEAPGRSTTNVLTASGEHAESQPAAPLVRSHKMEIFASGNANEADGPLSAACPRGNDR
jgi:hypothetical protein